MSAIAGIYFTDGQPVNSVDLEQMMLLLAPRGPNGTGIWNRGPIGLGHGMLWTTPESLREKLPALSKSGHIVLTCDARIDNRNELMLALGLKDRPANTIPDSDLILTAYNKWGEHCPKKLLGDFAFAIWDEPKQKLFCARDPMGIKPLFYYQSSSFFVFASEIKAILSLQEVPRKLNEMKVAEYLVPIFNDQISTYYQNLFRLPPAHCITIRDKGVKTWAYWRLDPTKELHLSSDSEYEAEFCDLFTESIRCRLRSAFPIGSTLSGGLDSSTIACTADKLLSASGGGPLHTFSGIFPDVAKEDQRIDERPFIDAVLAMGNFDPHYVPVDRCKPLADVSLHENEVMATPNLYMVSPLFSAARERGVRILLSGVDGDVTVSYGYEYLDQLARNGNWADFSREVRQVSRNFDDNPLYYLRRHGIPHLAELANTNRWWAFVKQLDPISKHFALSRLHLFMNAGLKQLIPHSLKGIWHNLRGYPQTKSPTWNLNKAIKPAFAKRIGLEERLRALEPADKSNRDHNLRDQHVHDLMSGYLQYLIGMFDQTAAAFSLEQRYPFFDRRLIEFCLALPLEQKLRQGWTRAILRYAMKNNLPSIVQWRTGKGNMSLNIRLRLLEDRETLDAVILDDPGPIEVYVDMLVLRDAYRRFLSQPAATSEEDLFTIYLAVTLALWLRQSEQFLTKM